MTALDGFSRHPAGARCRARTCGYASGGTPNCGINGKLSPHVLRHAFATHLVAHGQICARYKHAGHASISTTEIYTHVARERLRSIHAATHREVIGSAAD